MSFIDSFIIYSRCILFRELGSFEVTRVVKLLTWTQRQVEDLVLQLPSKQLRQECAWLNWRNVSWTDTVENRGVSSVSDTTEGLSRGLTDSCAAPLVSASHGRFSLNHKNSIRGNCRGFLWPRFFNRRSLFAFRVLRFSEGLLLTLLSSLPAFLLPQHAGQSSLPAFWHLQRQHEFLCQMV